MKYKIEKPSIWFAYSEFKGDRAHSMVRRLRSRVGSKGLMDMHIFTLACPYKISKTTIAEGFMDAIVLLMDYPHESFAVVAKKAIGHRIPLFVCRSMSVLYQGRDDGEFLRGISSDRLRNTLPDRVISDLDEFFREKDRLRRFLATQKKHSGQLEIFGTRAP